MDSGAFSQPRFDGCSLLVTVDGTRPPRAIDSITELYHFTLSHYGFPALWPTLRHHRWPLASQGLDTGGLLGLTGLGSHQLYVQHRTGARPLPDNSITVNRDIFKRKIQTPVPSSLRPKRTRMPTGYCSKRSEKEKRRDCETAIPVHEVLFLFGPPLSRPYSRLRPDRFYRSP